MRLVDLQGQRFGRLAVISRAPNKGKDIRWICQCDCGNTRVVYGGNVRRGLTESCGCLRLEVTRAKFTENLAGRRFGDLTAVQRVRDYVAPNGARHVRWECRCECGRSAVASANDLKSGHTTTCGCRRFARLLDTEHILYRLFDDAGDLLYVGITNRWSRRSGEHSRTKSWWPLVARVEEHSFPDRASVEAAEKEAIRSENPRHNVERYLGGDAK